jgi:CRISPR/Cas system-associated protein Cas10 (large subunit of type III CRISPR-Cas system)
VEPIVDPQREQLLLGALLHDVGKFVLRSRISGEGKDHAEIGEEWLLQYRDRLPPGVAHFARLHHSRYFPGIRQNNLTLLLDHADNLAAAGDRVDKEVGRTDLKKKGLKPPHTPLIHSHRGRWKD